MKATLDKNAIRIAYAAAPSDIRPALACVKIGNGKIVACDGFVIAVREIPIEAQDDESILVDAKTLLKIHQFLKGDFLVIECHDKKRAQFRNEHLDSHVVNIQLTDMIYPAYEMAIPQGEKLAFVALGIERVAQITRVMGTTVGCIKIKIRSSTSPVEVWKGKTRFYIMPYFATEED